MERFIIKSYSDVRDAIFQELYDIALKDPKVMVFSADLAAKMFEDFKRNLPAQFYNVGIAEQNAMSVAAGMSLTGRRVFVYGISNFVTLRCFEQIKIDICSMHLPVTILASGTGYMYGEDGPTHHMMENIAIMRTLPGITIWSPSDFTAAASFIRLAYRTPGPAYIIFDRGPFTTIYNNANPPDFSEGLSVIRSGKDLTIISVGIMMGQALSVADELKKDGLDVGVIDLYRLKPINEKLLFDSVKESKRIATIEEHSIIGGLGGAVCEFLAETGLLIPIKVFGMSDKFRCEVGCRELLRSLDGIDKMSILKAIKSWIK